MADLVDNFPASATWSCEECHSLLAATLVLWNFLMRHLFPGLPNCPALFSLLGSFSSSSFYHALFVLSSCHIIPTSPEPAWLVPGEGGLSLGLSALVFSLGGFVGLTLLLTPTVSSAQSWDGAVPPRPPQSDIVWLFPIKPMCHWAEAFPLLSIPPTALWRHWHLITASQSAAPSSAFPTHCFLLGLDITSCFSTLQNEKK